MMHISQTSCYIRYTSFEYIVTIYNRSVTLYIVKLNTFTSHTMYFYGNIVYIYMVHFESYVEEHIQFGCPQIYYNT